MRVVEELSKLDGAVDWNVMIADAVVSPSGITIAGRQFLGLGLT